MRRTCSPAVPIKAPCTMFRNTTPKPLPNNTENNTMTDGQNKDLLRYFYNITYIEACPWSALMVLKRKSDQGCSVPNLCSWPTRKSYNVLFSYQSCAEHPGFHKFRALGSRQFFLEHSWGLQKHDELTHLCYISFAKTSFSLSLPYAN